jgi:hypothetical protein
MVQSSYFWVVVIVSVITLVRIFSAAQELRRRGTTISIKLAAMLFGTCAEITLATVALFLLSAPVMPWILVWCGAKTAGRLIELWMVERFQGYLYETRAVAPKE